MNKRLAYFAGAILAASAIGYVAWDVSDPPETQTISGSYAFDVNNPELLAGYSDALAVVTVLDEGTATKVDEAVYTDFTVQLEQALKGELPAKLTVRQTGGKDGEDTFVLEDQPLLNQGQSYVVALSQEPGRSQFTLVAGPLSAKPLPSETAKRDEVLNAWATAIEQQKQPV